MSDPELERLLRFVYLCPVGVVYAARDGTIDLINPVASAQLMPLAKGGNLENLFSLLEPVFPGLADVVAGYAPESGTISEPRETRLPRGDGGVLVVAVAVFAIDRQMCAVVLSDITTVVEQARKLHLQDQRLRAVVDSVAEHAIFTLDHEGKIDEWNQSLSRFTRGDAQSVVGQPLGTLFECVPDPLDTGVLMEEALLTGKAKCDAAIRLSSGVRSVVAALSPLLDQAGHGTGFSVVLHDTTTQKANERRLLHLASTDALTGVPNRRAFLEAADHELVRSARYGRALSVLMLDVDHFKNVNDTQGHDVGDAVLVALAERCQRTVREVDLVGRLGGEEFAILAPETPLSNAGILAERLRELLSTMEVSTPSGPLRITVSIGVASRAGVPGETFAGILKRADVALYAAKTGGRNRVVLDA